MKLPLRSTLAHIHSSYSSRGVIPLTLVGDEVAQGMRLLEALSGETVRPRSSPYSLEGSHGWRIYDIADHHWWVRDQLCGFKAVQTFIWFVSADRLASSGSSHFEESSLRLVIKQIISNTKRSLNTDLIVCLLPDLKGGVSQALNAQARARETLITLGHPAPYQVKISLPGASKSSLLRSLSERGGLTTRSRVEAGVEAGVEGEAEGEVKIGLKGPHYHPHRFIDDWVEIPAGEVTGESGETWSNPAPFAIGQTAVTQSLYEAIMEVKLPLRYGPLYPAIAISWLDAVLFCNRLSETLGLSQYYEINSDQTLVSIRDSEGLGIRLPKRSEWCFAAAGERPWPYAGSDLPEEVAWSAHNSGSKIRPVARLKHNDFGCYDLSGNVWEWSEEGSRDNEQEEVCVGDHHPKWLLGGSWANHPWVFPIGESLSELPGYRDEFMGVRIARNLSDKETSPAWFITKEPAEESS